MIFWLIITSVTLITLLVSLWPLWAKGFDSSKSKDDNTKLYVNQLHALENDIQSGLIEEKQVEAIREEIIMHLSENSLVNNQGRQKTSNIKNIVLALIAAFVISCLTWSLYFSYGSPELSSKPLTSSTNEIIHPQKILMAGIRAQKKGEMGLALVYFQQLKNASHENSKAYELISKAIDNILMEDE
tara:strand:- start:705 stop:1262 length:558 start_codon:yes stop_codon:yes gene_type:complete